MNVQTEGIIVKTQKYKEYDEIVTAFTEKFGKLRMFSSSSKRLKNPNNANLQVFSLVDLNLDLRQDSAKLYSSKLIKSRYKYATDLTKYYLASYLLELIDKSMDTNQTDMRTYRLLKEALDLLEDTDRYMLLRVIFTLYFFETYGCKPDLTSCCVCSSNVNLKYIDITMGNAVCENCGKNIHNIYRMDKNSIRFINYVYSNTFENSLNVTIDLGLLRQISEFTERYFLSHIGNLNIKSYDLVKQEEEMIYGNTRKN